MEMGSHEKIALQKTPSQFARLSAKNSAAGGSRINVIPTDFIEEEKGKNLK